MEKRIKWYASPQITRSFLKALKGGLGRYTFTAKAPRGFLITSTRDDAINGSFIERITGKRVIPDPFGQIIELPFVTFETINFRLSSTFPQIELSDAPRNTKRLYIAINEVVPDTFAVEPIEWNVTKVLEEMTSFVENLRISEAHFVGVPISEGLVSDIVFYGSGDVRAGAQKEMREKSQRWGTAKGSFTFRDREYRFDLGSSAYAKLRHGPDERLVNHFRAIVSRSGTANRVSD